MSRAIHEPPPFTSSHPVFQPPPHAFPSIRRSGGGGASARENARENGEREPSPKSQKSMGWGGGGFGGTGEARPGLNLKVRIRVWGGAGGGGSLIIRFAFNHPLERIRGPARVHSRSRLSCCAGVHSNTEPALFSRTSAGGQRPHPHPAHPRSPRPPHTWVATTSIYT
jgi:hypothetical protein